MRLLQCYSLPGGEGRRGWRSVNEEDLAVIVIKNGLLDIPFKKGKFTWINRRLRFVNISKKMDRFLMGVSGLRLNGW